MSVGRPAICIDRLTFFLCASACRSEGEERSNKWPREDWRPGASSLVKHFRSLSIATCLGVEEPTFFAPTHAVSQSRCRSQIDENFGSLERRSCRTEYLEGLSIATLDLSHGAGDKVEAYDCGRERALGSQAPGPHPRAVVQRARQTRGHYSERLRYTPNTRPCRQSAGVRRKKKAQKGAWTSEWGKCIVTAACHAGQKLGTAQLPKLVALPCQRVEIAAGT